MSDYLKNIIYFFAGNKDSMPLEMLLKAQRIPLMKSDK